MKTKLIFSIFALVLFISSCKKDDDTNLTGYVKTGTNSNTVKTYPFTVNSWDWISDGTGGYYYHYNGIDASTNMKGSVMVYWQQASGYWAALPLTVGAFTITFAYNDNATLEMDITGATPGTDNFRCVIIPPSARMAHPSVNYNNYAEVKQAFHLKD